MTSYTPALHDGRMVDDSAPRGVPRIHSAEQLLHDHWEGLLFVTVGEVDRPHERGLPSYILGCQVRAEPLQLLDDFHVAHSRGPMQCSVPLRVDRPVRLKIGGRVRAESRLLVPRKQEVVQQLISIHGMLLLCHVLQHLLPLPFPVAG